MAAAAILLGVIGRPHGVRGHVRVHSYTARPEDVCAYGTLMDAGGRQLALRLVGAGIAEVSELVGGVARPVGDRAAAERLTNTQLFVERARLPAPEAEAVYLADLIGLRAEDEDGAGLGTVVAVHDYGAGASIELAGPGAPVLVPFTRAAVPEVDLAAGRVRVRLPAEVVVEGELEARSGPGGRGA